MLGLPSTTDLALLGVLCAAIAAGMLCERHEGAASVKAVDKTAELAQAAKDHQLDQDTISDLRAKLEALPPPVHAPPLRLCIPSGSVRALVSSGGTQPPVAGGTGEGALGVFGGTVAGPDIGPVVQDSKRAAEVVAIYRDTTWDWAVRQSK